MSASVVDVLDAQHRRVAELFEQVSLPDADRPRVLSDLLRELAAHLAAERSAVQPAVEKRDLGRGLQDDYDRIEKLMVLIERRKYNSPDLPELVTELKDATDAHVSRAETELFPALDGKLSPEEDSEMATAVENADSMVVTHPHPHLLSLGPISAKLTALMARFDRLRDRTVTNMPPSEGSHRRAGRGPGIGRGPDFDMDDALKKRSGKPGETPP